MHDERPMGFRTLRNHLQLGYTSSDFIFLNYQKLLNIHYIHAKETGKGVFKNAKPF